VYVEGSLAVDSEYFIMLWTEQTQEPGSILDMTFRYTCGKENEFDDQQLQIGFPGTNGF